MVSEHRFKQTVISTIAKRAANQCSNPDCGAITSGPTDDPTKAANVGEAAHIYGAHPGSARYDPEMASADRSANSNAIWLCSTCHKLVDDDPNHYPAGLLFEWLTSHEQRVRERIGKVSAEVRRRYEQRYLQEFGKLSYLAERLIVEKGDIWEYRLTAEILRFELAPVIRRWRALKQGLYMKPIERLPALDTQKWISMKIDEALKIMHAFDELVNNEFSRAWGEPGQPGNDIEIVETCRLYAEMCQSALRWEESTRFSKFDQIFEEVQRRMTGLVGMLIDEAVKIPEFIASRVGDVPELGRHELTLTLAFPEGHIDALVAALDNAIEQLNNN